MPAEFEPSYDLRHQLVKECPWNCGMCLNEGMTIEQSRGGTAENTPQLTLRQITDLHYAYYAVLGGNLRTMALSGGEPTLLGRDNLITVTREVNDNVNRWFLNTNAAIITREYARRLKEEGRLKTAKINVPSADPEKFKLIVTRGYNMWERQKNGILSLINEGVQVDLNMPLMKGINDTPDDVGKYAVFFKQQRYPGQVLLKIFQLEQGMYGRESDEIFYNKHNTPTQLLVNQLGARYIGEQDYGRMRMYQMEEDGVQMQLAVIDECAPENVIAHPTQNTAFVITHSGLMRRMTSQDPHYQFDFQKNTSLTNQVEEAIRLFERNKVTQSEEQESEALIINMINNLAGQLHNDWREPRRINLTRVFESRIKNTLDVEWIRQHHTDTVDIANTSFDELPADWQLENKRAAEQVVRIVVSAANAGRSLDETFIEETSSLVHEEWVERNPNASPDLLKPFNALSARDQEKNRKIVKSAVDLFQQTKTN